MTRKILYSICILSFSFIHPNVFARGAYKQRIDLLEKKFETTIKNQQRDIKQKQLTALACATEALSICALIEQTPDVKEILHKRIDQFHSSFKTSKTFEEKMLNSSVGFYNLMLMLGNIRCDGTLYMRPLRDIDAQTSKIGKNDSLDAMTKSAIIQSEAFKLVSLFTIATDTSGRYKSAIEKTGKAFDEDGRKLSKPEDGIALAAYQTAKILEIYTRLRFPKAENDLQILKKEFSQLVHSSGERIAIGFSGVFRVAIVLAHQLDQR